MALFVDLVALSNGLHGSVQMDSVALFSWIGWLRHHGIFIGALFVQPYDVAAFTEVYLILKESVKKDECATDIQSD